MAFKFLFLTVIILFKSVSANEQNLSNYEKAIESTSQIREYIKENLLDVSNNIDRYISNNNDKTLKNGTNLKLTFFSYKQESESYTTNYKLKLRIKLPNIEKKLKLIIIDEKGDTDIKDNEHRNNESTKQSVALQYNLVDNFKHSLKASVGLRLKEELHRYIRLTYKTSFLLNKSIITKVGQKFRYSSDKKLVTTSSIDFTKYLNYTFILTNHNEYKWEKEENINSLFNSIKLYQILSKREYFGYSLTKAKDDFESSFNTKEYQIIFQYRNYIKKWLYFEVIPKVRYIRENDFSARHQLRFNLSFYFGHN